MLRFAYATDIALVESLAAEKLNSEAEKVSAEGWLWVECHAKMPNEAYRLRRVHRQAISLTEEQQAELDRLDEEYKELAALIEECDGDDEQESRFDQVVTQIEALQAAEECYTPEDISRAGAYVCIDHSGKLRIELGFIRAEPSDDDDHNDAATDGEEGNDTASVKTSTQSHSRFRQLLPRS